MAYFKQGTVYNGEAGDKVSFIFSRDNLKYDLSRSQFDRFVREMGYCVAPNGCVFDQKVPGVFAQYMSEVFANRSEVRKKIKENNKEIEQLQKELEKLK